MAAPCLRSWFTVTRLCKGFTLQHAASKVPLLHQHSRCLGSVAAPAPVSQSEGKRTVTLIPGDGVWPELIEASVKEAFTYIGVPIHFEEQFISDISPHQSKTLDEVLESLRKNSICLKGILKNPATGMLESLNLRLRKKLDAFANVVLVKSLPGLTTRYSNLDFVIIREQTEGEYTHLEHESVPGVVESLKVVTAEKSRKIAKFAFDYATKYGRKKVTAVHKANIMKLSDGLFLESCKEISELYPTIKFESMIVDNTCMQLVSNPHQFDVMVMPNLYGSIIDNIGASLVGGAGVVPGATYGRQVAFFEPGARHSFAEAQGRDVANPTAILLSAAQMLNHMHLETYGKQIENAVHKVIKAGKVRTRDMGGYATTSAYMKAIFAAL